MPAAPARRRAYFWLAVNTLVWGAVPPLIKPALQYIDPFALLFSRFWLASLLILPVVVWYLWRQPHLWRSIPKIIGLEIIGTVLSLGLLYVGLQRTEAVMASVLGATSPLFITVGGLLFCREKETVNEWWGLSLALVGVVLLAIEPIIFGRSSWQLGSLDGNFLILLSCLVGAWYYLQVKKHYHYLPKLFAAGVGFLVGWVGFALIVLVQAAGTPAAWWTTVQLWSQPLVGGAVLYMAVGVSVIGLTSYILGQDLIEASEASIFTYLQPMVAAPLAFFFLHEQITWWQVITFFLILIGVWLAQHHPRPMVARLGRARNRLKTSRRPVGRRRSSSTNQKSAGRRR